jgi:hypothetical protein
MIAILEDEEERQIAMKEQLELIGYKERACFFDNAPEMIEWLKDNLEKVIIICLDHDLGPNREKDGKIFDPGDGRNVVDFLVSQNVQCPVIVHTSNYLAAPGMILALESSFWSVFRVVPFNGVSWIELSWFPLLQQILSL